MLALFVAIMLVNTLVAATRTAGGEFARQRLAGATPGPGARRWWSRRALLLTVTGVVFGTVASVVTVLPFGIARGGRSAARSLAAPPLPDRGRGGGGADLRGGGGRDPAGDRLGGRWTRSAA